MNLKAFALVGFAALFSSGTKAAELIDFDLDCGKSMNVKTTIKVREAKSGAFKPLVANYKGPSIDLTTGMALRGHSIADFEGAPETQDGRKLLVFVSASQPLKQLYIDRPTQIGQTVEVAHMVLNDKTNPYIKELSCIVKKAAN